MGTWGAGPFDNDSADELTDVLRVATPGHRAESLSGLLSTSIEEAENADPSEVVAAALIVAASLPGSELANEFPAVAHWLDAAAAVDLSVPAVQALRVCLPEGGWYWQSWTREQDRSAARGLVANLVATLNETA